MEERPDVRHEEKLGDLSTMWEVGCHVDFLPARSLRVPGRNASIIWFTVGDGCPTAEDAVANARILVSNLTRDMGLALLTLGSVGL